MKHNNLKGSLLLCLAAFVWGLAFTAQSSASSVPPFLLNSLRSFISLGFLFILFKIVNIKTKERLIPKDKAQRKTVFIGSIVCGTFLTIAANFQQFGIAMYKDGEAGEAHAGFITAMYVIIVPIISVFLRKKISLIVFVAAAISVLGFYFLCFSEGLGGFYKGDLLVLLCAFCFSFQILAIDKYVGKIGGIRLSLFQFLVVGILSGVMSLIFEFDKITLNVITDNILPIVYLGIFSSGIGYTLQIVGQKYAQPAVASISMSLESVFAALGGWLIAGNALASNEILGCVLVFAAIITAQLPDLINLKKKTA